MKPVDKENNIVRYTDRYKQHGYSPLSLGWGENSKQTVRFQAIKEIGILQTSSILDIGCGFADFYKFLKKEGWKGQYAGIDLVPSLLNEAKIQNPGIDVRKLDILADPIGEKFDFVVASGIFNAPLSGENNYEHTFKMLKKMFSLAQVGVAADFLSTFVDYQEPGHFHSDPMKIFYDSKTITKRVTLRHDYMPFEFMVYLFVDDAFSKGNHVFTPVNQRISK